MSSVRGGVGNEAVDADRLSGRTGGNAMGDESNIACVDIFEGMGDGKRKRTRTMGGGGQVQGQVALVPPTMRHEPNIAIIVAQNVQLGPPHEWPLTQLKLGLLLTSSKTYQVSFRFEQ